MMTADENSAVVERIAMSAGLSCLGDVLRSGYQFASLYLSSPTQIRDLAGPVSATQVKAEFTNWRIVSFQLTHPLQNGLQLILVGERGPKYSVTVTSPLVAVDMTQGLVMTRNSVYRLQLDARGVDEPPAKHLMVICRTLRSWGLGRAFDIPLV
jgi:hypothetical protein